MRLWSLHPKYLDKIGLVALWREGLLAKKVLEGSTKGYKNHPQLIRFKDNTNCLDLINSYLYFVYLESCDRNYKFDINKIKKIKLYNHIDITDGQLQFEFQHLQNKLFIRDPKKYKENMQINTNELILNPVFCLIKGKIAQWEKI